MKRIVRFTVTAVIATSAVVGFGGMASAADSGISASLSTGSVSTSTPAPHLIKLFNGAIWQD
jgi:uncharacterized membrane protein YtjA (UPF0391 family)